jgi:hypothetical protein
VVAVVLAEGFPERKSNQVVWSDPGAAKHHQLEVVDNPA